MARSVITIPVSGTTVFDPNAPVLVPSAPTLQSVTPGNGENALSWSASPGATAYNVFFSTSPGVTTGSTEIGLGDVTSFTHTGLVNGTEYYYRIQAVGSGGGESALSNELSGTPTAAAFDNNFSQDLNGVDQAGVIPASSYPEIEFDRTDSFTYSFWVKWNALSGNQQIWDQRVGSNGSGLYFYKASNNTIRMEFEDSGGALLSANTIAVVPVDQWVHIVYTYDGSSANTGISIYLDSASQALSRSGGPLAASVTYGINLFVGVTSVSDTAPSVRYLDALIDEFSVWDKELDQTEVDELYNSGIPADLTDHSASANLVKWWRMGDATDTALVSFDQINNADITWLNAPTYSSDVP